MGPLIIIVIIIITNIWFIYLFFIPKLCKIVIHIMIQLRVVSVHSRVIRTLCAKSFSMSCGNNWSQNHHIISNLLTTLQRKIHKKLWHLAHFVHAEWWLEMHGEYVSFTTQTTSSSTVRIGKILSYYLFLSVMTNNWSFHEATNG
jgi:hypothetical protein